jgi:energy-coupling factor transport system permease protein
MARALRDITIGGYIPAESPVHSLDPRTKLIGLPLMLVTVFLAATPASLAVTALFSMFAAWACRMGLRVWWTGLSRFAWMLAIVAILHLFLDSWGRPAAICGLILPFTVEGVQSSALFTLQLAQSIILSLTLTFTTSPVELTKAVRRLCGPLRRLRVPVDEAAAMILIAMRFAPAVQLELRSTIEAQQARGVDFGAGGPLLRARNLLAALVPALLGALKRADQLAVAMSARGFRAATSVSNQRPRPFSSADYWAAAVLGLTLLVSLAV